MFSYEPETRFDLCLPGRIRKGHGVASGSAASSPYPEGTLALQAAIFKLRGVDLQAYHRGTLNVDISPRRFELIRADVTLRDIRWTDRIPPEHFSFSACLLEACNRMHHALIYHPHPETKTEHFQSESLVEVLAPFIEGVSEGSPVVLRVCGDHIRLRD